MKSYKIKYVYYFLFLTLVILSIILLFKNNSKEYFNNNEINNFVYYNEKDELIDNKNTEYVEQLQAATHITPDSVVLELGARYGSVSCVINSKLNNKNNQVSVEPDSNVWNALENNMKRNNTQFNIVKGFISSNPMELEGDGYALTFKDTNNSTIAHYTLDNIKQMYNLEFNTLVADCEGCLERFFDENKDLYSKLNLVIMEEDYPEKCNYDKIKTELKNNGFTLIDTDSNNFHTVWKKYI